MVMQRNGDSPMTEPSGTVDAILAWSSQRPLWQQDLLRRLVIRGNLTDQDKVELKLMARRWAGLKAEGAVEPCPLEAAHFPSKECVDQTLKLVAIKGLAGVNALLEGQTLSVGANGLTAIYGSNGAGKSGYFRVLKLACQARGAEPIIGDVRLASPPKPRATFEVSGSEIEQRSYSVHWDESTPLPDLKQFSLFDTECGRQIVGTASDPVFLPVGLEAFSPFAAFLDEVSSAFEVGIQKFRDTQQVAHILLELRGNHEVGRLLGGFPDRVTKDALEALVGTLEADAEELRSIEIRLKELEAGDPATKIASLDAFRKRLEQERTRLAAFKVTFEPASLRLLSERWAARKVALEAREQAKDLQPQGSPLAGVRSNPWHELFKAARAYSIQEAYPGKAFPVTDPGARCVLCMQPLDEEAADRLRRFETFVQDTTEKTAAKADLGWKAAFATLAEVRLDPTNSVLLEEILREAPALHSEWAPGCEALRECHRRALDSFQKGTPPVDLVPETTILGSIERVVLSLDERIKGLSAGNPAAEAAPLKLRATELRARLSLGSHKPALFEALERKATADRLTKLLPDLATRAITDKQKALAKEAIEGRYGEALGRELDAIEVDRFKLRYKSSASKGQLLQQLHLPDALKASKPEQVLSEGEHRVAALAAFLAEVSLRPIHSGIILDDPVSSLDHDWAEKVAKRLVDEAKVRQVVIFTHHLHFLHMLRDIAFGSSPQVPFHSRTIEWSCRRPGFVVEGLPWLCAGVLDSIRQLARDLEVLQQLYNANPTSEEYGLRRSQFVDRLRSTWERLVEEDLFNGVVTRFNKGVATQKLNMVVLEDEDYQTVFTKMAEVSDRTEAHNHSIHSLGSSSSPRDLGLALEALKAFRTSLKTRQDAALARRKLLKGPR